MYVARVRCFPYQSCQTHLHGTQPAADIVHFFSHLAHLLCQRLLACVQPRYVAPYFDPELMQLGSHCADLLAQVVADIGDFLAEAIVGSLSLPAKGAYLAANAPYLGTQAPHLVAQAPHLVAQIAYDRQRDGQVGGCHRRQAGTGSHAASV